MALICSMMILDASIVSKINYEHIVLCSALVTALDLVLDPIAIDEGRWYWDKPGKYYGVPIKNFIGWFFNSAVILITFSILSYPFSNENNFPAYIEFSPGILFIVLPAIASRPCFERDLNKAGAVGIIITLILIFLCGIIFYRAPMIQKHSITKKNLLYNFIFRASLDKKIRTYYTFLNRCSMQ